MLDQLYWTFIVEKVFYVLFSNLMLLFALATVASRNPIHSILSLIGLFVVSSFMMILAGAEFLAYVYIIVYVGAIAVLFLFIIMMVNVKSIPLINGYDSNIFFLALVPVVVFTFMWEESTDYKHITREYFEFFESRRFTESPYFYPTLENFFEVNPTLENFISSTKSARHWKNPAKWFALDDLLISSNPLMLRAPVTFVEFYMIYNSVSMERVRPFTAILPSKWEGISNIEALGYVLYTKYFLVFLLSGIALFVAMIGAIVLTKYQGREPIKKADPRVIESKSEEKIYKYRTPFF